MKLIVGLGNPGPQYRNTRHNIGFLVLDRLAQREMGSEWREKFQGVVSQAVIAGNPVWLLKPMTFMNVSGSAVVRATQQLGIKAPEVLVVHDDLELPFGELRGKLGGGLAGHNGLRSLNTVIGADFARLRMGIGRPTQGTVESWVLSSFGPDEQRRLDAVLDDAVAKIAEVVARGLPEAAPGRGGAKKA
ncbi:MAG: aminoacyl-tRNA hydrolase [Myxococcales bacterium]|nr:aminoacyl-tRNA hydrolase [Myxococcales bacterium]